MITSGPKGLLSIAQSGLLPLASGPKKIVVVGAGMAGLVAAYELQRAGHQVSILEARERIGGRIETLRDPFGNGLHAEAGAMRIPSTHKLIQAYIQKFGLQTIEFTAASPNALFYVNGRRRLRGEVERDPACLGLNFAGPNGSQTVLQLWAEFLRSTTQQLGLNEGHWDDIVREYERFSLHDYLRSQNWSTEAITSFVSAEGLEGVQGLSFVELLKVELAWQGASMSQIVGGMDQLPMAFLPELQNHIQFGAEMVALDHTSDSATIHYKHKGVLRQVTADFAILTNPYPTMRFVDVLKPFSHGKQMAIRQLHYMDVVKIFLKCRRRFWEEEDGIFGGSTTTDLPIQTIFYPDHGRETKQGVLMGCFALGEAANRWASLSPEDRIAQTLKYVSHVHPQVTGEFETGVSKVWSEDKFAGGAVAAYEPGQETALYHHMITPEGPIHFAGEHASSKHFWIEGAVESGLRAAKEIHERSLMDISN